MPHASANPGENKKTAAQNGCREISHLDVREIARQERML